MNETQFKRDIVLALYYLMDWIKLRNRWDLFQNIPSNFKKNQQMKTISDSLYNIYAFDFKYHHHVNNPVEQELVIDITRELEVFRAGLEAAARLCSSHAKKGTCDQPDVSQDGGWILSGTKGSSSIDMKDLKMRVYINTKTEQLASFVAELLNVMSTFHERFRFKFVNPLRVETLDLMRPEKIVLYFAEGTDFKAIYPFLYKMRYYFDKQTPLFVEKVLEGVGFAPHITPAVQEYLDAPTNSYGDTVCTIIARSLLSFVFHYKRIPSEKEYHLIADSVYQIIYIQAFRSAA
jgi:hypothetical protein